MDDAKKNIKLSNAVAEIFDKSPPGSYDERNRKLAPISANLHFLSELVLQELPADARVLCVGVGTGAEILSLARANPGWTFVGIDPSATMLADCRKRLEQEGFSSRCTLFHGYLADFKTDEVFDGAVCFLVMHFVQDLGVRAGMYKDMADRLKPGGILVNAEISYDLEDAKFPDIFEKWKLVQKLMGAQQEGLDKLLGMFRSQLLVLAPARTEELIEGAGFSAPVQFFQSFLIHACYARKK